VLWVIALVGAARVFLFSSAFPLFNNVDEYSHFDAVCKYSRGALPHPERLHHDASTSRLIIWLGSPEYVVPPSRVPGGVYPRPPWSVSPEAASARLREGVRRLRGVRKNHELAQPPVYYAVAGGWYRLGETLRLPCGHLVFSIRWLNALFMVGLVWAAHRLACATGRRDPLTRIGVPLLVALFPQDAFYSISNDALSPLLTASALLAILRMHGGHPRSSASVVAGLLTASAVLTKYTNCVVLIPAIAFTGMNLWKREFRQRGWLRCNLLFWVSAFAPIVAWGVRNAVLFGDPTARRLFFESLGWQPKPLGALFDHPIFSFPGLLHFLDGLCRDFWRGRFMWNGEFMAHTWADAVYVATSGVFLVVATVAVARECARWLRNRRLPAQPNADLGAWLTVAGGVALLAFFSIWIETGERSVPPRDDPFFTMGRLISGCIVPFALLYVRGLGATTTWISERARASVRAGLFGLVVATIAISEVWLSERPARSEYNWFHLVSAEHGRCAATPRWLPGVEAGGEGVAHGMRDWQDPAMPRNDAADDR
jgi:hypothetical protein